MTIIATENETADLQSGKYRNVKQAFDELLWSMDHVTNAIPEGQEKGVREKQEEVALMRFVAELRKVL